MKATVNGKPAELASQTTLAALLKEMGIEPLMVACEVNEKIVRRKEYAATVISEGDRIEILQMIGGG